MDSDDGGRAIAIILPNIAPFAELGQWGDAQPSLLGNKQIAELVDSDDGGRAIAIKLPNVVSVAELGQWGDAQPSLLGNK